MRCVGGRPFTQRIFNEQGADDRAGRVNRVALVLSIIFMLALIGSIAANVYASGQTSLFNRVEYGASLQNSQVYVDEELGITFLGTYQNVVLAFDENGNELWRNEISGAVSAMKYDVQQHWLMVGSQDRNIYIYQAGSGQLVNTLAADGKVSDMDYDQASGMLAVSSSVNASKNYLKIFNVQTGEEILKMKLKNQTNGIRFSADKQSIFYGDNRARVTKVDLNGEQLAQEKARSEVRGMQVVAETGDVLVLDENNNLFRFDSELNKINSVSLVGEGWALGTSEDGRWIGVGTREGDTYILDADGVTHFSNRSEAKISQIYFGTDRCFVVTQSKDLYEFSVDRLDNIGAQSKLKSMSVWMIAGSAVALFASAVVAFPRSRRAGKRFFRAIHRHRTAYLMLAPSIVLILIFNYYNVFQAFYYAFTDWSLSTRTMREVNFVGFDNFVKMINEGYFLLGVKNLAILMIANFVKLLTVPVLLAELVFAMRTLDGKVVGHHDGLMYYTLGQRRGLGIGGSGDGRRWFVVGKDLQNNVLLVEQGEDSPLLYSDAAECELPSWAAGHAPVEPGERLECKVRLRHRQPLQDAYLALTDDGFRLDFAQKQRAVTPGQAAVVYVGDYCLGGGTVRAAL